MDEKTKLYVFAKKEVWLIFVFIVLIAVTAFGLGVKVGKSYSFKEGGFTQEDRQRIDLLSEQEESVDAVMQKSDVNVATEDQLHQDTNERLKQIVESELGKSTPSSSNNSQQPINVESDASVKKITEGSVPEKSKYKRDDISGKYTIQLSAHRSLDDAEKFADGFRVRGYDPVINEAEKSSGIWYQVSIGVFDTIQEAKQYIIKEDTLFKGTDAFISKFD